MLSTGGEGWRGGEGGDCLGGEEGYCLNGASRVPLPAVRHTCI